MQVCRPFSSSDTLIDITNIIDDSRNNIITKSNRRISIIENNIHITDGLKEDSFQQLLNNKTYHSNIYTLPIFKAIRGMLLEIKENNIIKLREVVAAYGYLFNFRYINH